MEYTGLLKFAAFQGVVKNFTKMPMRLGLGDVFNLSTAYHPFISSIKGKFNEVSSDAFKTASTLDELELANKYLRKASLPGVITSLPNAVGATAGALALGALAHHFWKTVEPDIKSMDIDDLYKKLSAIEPEITNYPSSKAKHYMQILLEHSKALSTKPRIFAATLVRMLPFPTFPYEQLSNLDKITGSDEIGRLSNLTSGMSSSVKMLGV